MLVPIQFAVVVSANPHFHQLLIESGIIDASADLDSSPSVDAVTCRPVITLNDHFDHELEPFADGVLNITANAQKPIDQLNLDELRQAMTLPKLAPNPNVIEIAPRLVVTDAQNAFADDPENDPFM